MFSLDLSVPVLSKPVFSVVNNKFVFKICSVPESFSQKGLNPNDVVFLNLTSNFDGVRMFKKDTTNGEVYIWYAKIVQLGDLGTKEENIMMLAVLEKKKDTPFSDDLLIPLYSQMLRLFCLYVTGRKRQSRF